jgi:sporulation protein YlmC with PRC-barrel domain
MPELHEFRLGAEVVDKDGQKAGILMSVLVDEDGFDPKELVVKDETSLVSRLLGAERLLITDEVVIPISVVESATHDQVRLSISGSDVRRQKPYLSYRFRAESMGQALLREAQLLGGGLALPDVEEVADKPPDEIEIERDEKVMIGKTGRCVGKVRDLLYDQGELIGVVVRPEGLFKHDVVLPIRFLTRSDDLALFAGMREEDVETLKPFVEP